MVTLIDRFPQRCSRQTLFDSEAYTLLSLFHKIFVLFQSAILPPFINRAPAIFANGFISLIFFTRKMTSSTILAQSTTNALTPKQFLDLQFSPRTVSLLPKHESTPPLLSLQVRPPAFSHLSHLRLFSNSGGWGGAGGGILFGFLGSGRRLRHSEKCSIKFVCALFWMPRYSLPSSPCLLPKPALRPPWGGGLKMKPGTKSSSTHTPSPPQGRSPPWTAVPAPTGPDPSASRPSPSPPSS